MFSRKFLQDIKETEAKPGFGCGYLVVAAAAEAGLGGFVAVAGASYSEPVALVAPHLCTWPFGAGFGD